MSHDLQALILILIMAQLGKCTFYADEPRWYLEVLASMSWVGLLASLWPHASRSRARTSHPPLAQCAKCSVGSVHWHRDAFATQIIVSTPTFNIMTVPK